MTDGERAGLRRELLAILTRLRFTKDRKTRDALRQRVYVLRDALIIAGDGPANTERER